MGQREELAAESAKSDRRLARIFHKLILAELEMSHEAVIFYSHRRGFMDSRRKISECNATALTGGMRLIGPEAGQQRDAVALRLKWWGTPDPAA